MDLGLAGKTAIVTGGSSGIGLATVRLMLAEGMSVFVLARDPERLETALSRLEPAAGGTLGWASCDVLVEEAVASGVEQALAALGGIDVLVCNAGQARQGTFASTALGEWRDELDLKFLSVLHPLHASAAHLRESGGAVVLVNAVLARQPEPQLVATAAARAGVLNLARSLARELAPDVRVNSILVGLIRSGQWHRRWEAAGSGLDEETWLAGIAESRQIPLGRLGRPEEAAAAIVFLASPQAGYITGAALEVDGGVARYA